MKLTGKIKFRIESSGFFNSEKVILQVEHEWENGPDDFNGLPTYLCGKGWRDAKAEDLQYIKKFNFE